MIKAEIVAHSLSPQGDELISVLCTFPRIILAEVNTHNMLSNNTSSSRAIPFKKMIKAIQDNPFIPIAWQKDHRGMQGTEYFNDKEAEILKNKWLKARDRSIENALDLASGIFDMDEVFKWDEEGNLVILQTVAGTTKQLCNRLLEPFMWTTMLITGSRQGWDNFFKLRCPQYELGSIENKKSWKDICKEFNSGEEFFSLLDRLQHNKGQSEIHMMALAEAIWDSTNESIPKQLKAEDWHVPFEDKMYKKELYKLLDPFENIIPLKVKISTAIAARTSYTIIGEKKKLSVEKLISLHDQLINQKPPHSSPLEHCARAMNNDEYSTFIKGNVNIFGENTIHTNDILGWCYKLKGFIPYRYFIDNKRKI